MALFTMVIVDDVAKIFLGNSRFLLSSSSIDIRD